MKDFILDESLGFLVNRIAIILRQNLEAEFKKQKYDITAEEWVLLNRLWQKDRRTQTDLAETTIRDQTTVTRLVDRMESKGLVTREQSQEDRRIVLACLTAKGRRLEEKLIPIAVTLLRKAAGEVSQKDRETTLKTLRTVLENLLQE